MTLAKLKSPARPVRVEYWGVVRGSGPEAVQVLECRVTTPKRAYVVGYDIAVLPPIEISEAPARTQKLEAYTKAELSIRQKADVRSAIRTARQHMAYARYSETIEKLISEMTPAQLQQAKGRAHERS